MRCYWLKVVRALGFLVIFAQDLLHQFASIFITFHPDVSQACPKTMIPETQAGSRSRPTGIDANVSERGQVNMTPERSASCSTI